MSPLALLCLSWLAVFALGVGAGVRIGWMLWRREKRSDSWTYVRPKNVIPVTSGELRSAAGRSG